MALIITIIYALIYYYFYSFNLQNSISTAIFLTIGGIIIAFGIIKLFDICLKIAEKYGDKEEVL